MGCSKILLLTLLLSLSSLARAQSVGVGYYDLDGLYDTIPSPHYNDEDFTPHGLYNWNSERYELKIRNTAAVLDSMALPIVGLYGVENKNVVRDLVATCSQDYSFIHRPRSSLDGQDFALLYFGDQLMVHSVEAQRYMLIVEATLPDNIPITIILTRHGGDLVDHLDLVPREQNVVVLGKVSRQYLKQLKLVDVLESAERSSHGNYLSYRGWMLHDRIGVSEGFKILKSGIFITPWLLDSNSHSPLPTINKSGYIGGYSKYLPVFSYIF